MTTTPIDLDTLRLASGIWGDDPEALALVRARLLVVLEQESPSLTMLTDSGDMGMPYAVLALHALDDVAGAVALLGYHWHDPVLLTDPRVRAWAQVAEWYEIRPLAGRRHPWEPDSLPNLVLAQFEDLGDWGTLRLRHYAKLRTADPRDFNWDAPGALVTELAVLAYELPGADKAGNYTFVEAYADHADVNADHTGWADPEVQVPVVETIKVLTAGADGPAVRQATYRLYYDDGSYIEWTKTPDKVYPPDEQIRMGEARRGYVKRRLTALLRSLVAGMGGSNADAEQMLIDLDDPIKRFTGAANAGPLVAALALDPALSSYMPIIEAQLYPWLPEPAPEE